MKRLLAVIPAVIYYLCWITPWYWTGFVSNLKANIEIANISATIFLGLLTIVGWVIVNSLGLKTQRILIRDNAGLKIYEELAKNYKGLQSAAAQLQARLTVSTRLQKLLKQGAGALSIDTLDRHYQDQRNDFVHVRQDFHDHFFRFIAVVDIWSSQIFEMSSAYKNLLAEHQKFSKLLQRFESTINSIDIHDIEHWDQNKFQEQQSQTALCSMIFLLYLQDFMGLVHNELAAPLLGRDKPPRSLSESEFPVLTKWGIAEPAHPSPGYIYLKHLYMELDVENVRQID